MKLVNLKYKTESMKTTRKLYTLMCVTDKNFQICKGKKLNAQISFLSEDNRE